MFNKLWFPSALQVMAVLVLAAIGSATIALVVMWGLVKFLTILLT